MKNETAFVVLIDDEPDVLDSFKMLLECFEFEVLAAESAADAIAGLRERDRVPDVVVADYRLADRKLGTDAIRLISEVSGASIPGIIVTGDTSPERIQEAFESGFRILHKPVRAESLKDEIHNVLGWVS